MNATKPKKVSLKTKRSDLKHLVIVNPKKCRLTKTGNGVIGSFVTESTVYYKPLFMFTVGKYQLFRLQENYKIFKVLTKPFEMSLAHELFEIYHEEILFRYIDQNTEQPQQALETITFPKGFRKNLKKAKIECLFEAGVVDLEQIAKDYNIKIEIVKEYYKKYSEGRSILPQKANLPKIQDQHLKYLKDFLSLPEHVTSTLSEMRDRLLQNFEFADNKLSLTTVSKAVSQVGYSRKKVSKILEKQNTEETKIRRKQVVLQMTYFLYHKKEIVYIDESSFHIGMCLHYGYSEKGKKAVVTSQPKSINYSLLAAIYDGGILGFQVFKGSVKSEDFNGFMANLINQLKLDEQEREVVFFMDNASIHKNFDLRTEIATQVMIVYNAPYSPFLNPIEECFSLWKYHVRKRHPTNERDLIQALLSAAHEISSINCKKFIAHSLKFYPRCFNNEDISA